MKILRAKQVCEILSVSNSTFRRMIAAGDFPSGVSLSPIEGRCRAVGWPEEIVEDWYKNKFGVEPRHLSEPEPEPEPEPEVKEEQVMVLHPLPTDSTCRACGAPSSYNIMNAENLCSVCVNFGNNSTNAKSVEELLVKRITMLARRSVNGQPIIRCEAVAANGFQCGKFASDTHGDHAVCNSHKRSIALHGASPEFIRIGEQLNAGD